MSYPNKCTDYIKKWPVMGIFSSLEPKAEVELLWSLTAHHLSTPLNNISLETLGLIFFNFHVKSSFKGGLKIFTNGNSPFSLDGSHDHIW